MAKPTQRIPEPSPKVAVLVVALMAAIIGVIVTYDFAIGDPRVALHDKASSSK